MESTERGDVPVDVYQKLADDRILFICNDISDDLATYIVANLLLKDSEDPNQKIISIKLRKFGIRTGRGMYQKNLAEI